MANDNHVEYHLLEDFPEVEKQLVCDNILMDALSGMDVTVITRRVWDVVTKLPEV